MAEPDGTRRPYVLGIRLGVASLGWAALTLSDERQPNGLLAIGARKFMVGARGDIARGRETGPSEGRRNARANRVRLRRRIERLRTVWGLLQGAQLLPPGPFKERDALLKAFDKRVPKYPYVLRARALDGPLTAHELGRAIYHLAQRRGFQSNRRAAPKADEEIGVVKRGIADLAKSIAEAGARTLGEYLAKKEGPIRRRWTARDMYRAEFEAIVAAQRPHHPVVSEKLARKIALALFSQRPLRSQSGRIGRCDLEPARHRTAMAALDAQEFRVLCAVNNLRLIDDLDGEVVALTAAHRKALLERLRDGDATFPAIRKALGLPRSVHFNAERVDDEKLVGFRTAGKMRAAMGPLWDALERERQSALITDLLTIDEEGVLQRRLLGVWGFGEEVAARICAITLESAYASLSRKAIVKLLPRLREGVAYATARKELYLQAEDYVVSTRLPRVDELYKSLPNPLVRRALAELRVVVNAIVGRWGRPQAIRISLLRELRIGRKARERIWIKMRARNKQRAAATAKLLQDLGVQDPPRWMVDRVLLAEECQWTCPFTGKTISIRALFGDSPTFDAIYIVPFAVSLDDGFENKALCHTSMSRERRVDPKTIERFEKLEGPFAKEKLRRLRLSPEEIAVEYGEAAITERFGDTCYASKLGADMLSHLYPPSTAAVSAVRGAVTSYLREGSGLNRIELPDASYRRTTVDAIATALAGPTTARRLSAAAQNTLPGRRRFNPEQVAPWPDFVEHVRSALEEVTVSARVRRKVSGALHEQTFYRRVGEEKGRPYYSVHKHLWQLMPADVAQILGTERREVVEAKLKELGQGDPRKAFAKPENLPVWRGATVRRVPIRRNDPMFEIGKARGHARFVAVDRNHHAAVYLRLGRAGQTVADQAVVSQFEAQKRLAERAPIVQPPSTPCAGLRTLAPSETLDCRASGEGLWTVRSISPSQPVEMTALDDGRKLSDIAEAKDRFRRSVEQLRSKGAQKVVVTPLGEVRRDGT